MHDEQRPAQRRNPGRELLLRDVGKELALDVERPPGERDRGFSIRLDLRRLRAQQAEHMCRIAWRGDRYPRLRFRDLGRRREHRGAAEAMADEQRWRAIRLAQVGGGGDKVRYVGREV